MIEEWTSIPGGQTTTQNQLQNESGTQAGSQTGTTQQNVNVGPWGPTQGLLTNIIGSLGGTPTAPTAAQTGAISGLEGAVTGLPNFSGQATDLTNRLFGATPQNTGILSGAYGQASGALSPYLSSSYLNPMTNPDLGAAMSTLNNDITNQVNSQFAAAGRDLSPANSTALARGLSQGEGQLLADQYNKNVAAQQGAASQLESAAGSTASGLTGLEQTALQNQLQGLGVAGQVPGLAMAPGEAALNVANTAYGLPFQNLGMLENMVLPIGSAGQTGQTTGQTTGTSAGSFSGTGNMTGSQTQQVPLINNIIGGGLGGLGLLGQTGAFGSGGWLGSLASMLPFSDRRVKEDVHEIGMLYDETPVYSFKYIGDSVPRVGLMAQDVEKDRPEAVGEIGGVKVVNYDKATARARFIGGMLHDLDMAA